MRDGGGRGAAHGLAALVGETLGYARDEQDGRRMSHNPAMIMRLGDRLDLADPTFINSG